MPIYHKVVFTDIDGTLIDINTAQYGKNTNKLASIMIEKDIPLVLTSAKTRSEQNEIRKTLGLPDPFIVENGGAIFIPEGYFHDTYLKDINYRIREICEIEKDNETDQKQILRGGGVTHNAKKTFKLIVIELGKSSEEIRTKLADIRKKYNINFKGVSDIPIEELGSLTSLPKEQAKKMAQRDYGETILQIERDDISRFTKYAQKGGMKVLHGGRFLDVTIGTDKGIAVRILKKLFKTKFNNNVTFFGIGDSANDIPMLNLMDIAILVQRPDGSWLDYSRTEKKTGIDNETSSDNIIKVNGIGPYGWENAMQKIILELN